MTDPEVTLYTRAGCYLCDEAKRVLESAPAARRFRSTRKSISMPMPDLRRLYNDEVPVIAIDGRKAFKYRVTMRGTAEEAGGARMSLDLLAIAAHPDDVEQTCGGTLIKMAETGYRTGVLDLTAGDMGTRGTPEQRVAESRDRGAKHHAAGLARTICTFPTRAWRTPSQRA